MFDDDKTNIETCFLSLFLTLLELPHDQHDLSKTLVYTKIISAQFPEHPA